MDNEIERQIFKQMNKLLNQHDDLFNDQFLSSPEQRDYFLYKVYCDSVIKNLEK